jgi:branched-chain amino acid transport system substrate-binding protein
MLNAKMTATAAVVSFATSFASPAQADDFKIIIGAAVAQSGLFSQFDLPALQMVEIAIDDLNARGGIDGREVVLITSDTGSRVEEGRAAAMQVIDAGAELILVTCDFDFGSPAANTAQEAGLVVFSLCAQSPKFGVQGIGPLAYTAAPATYNEGAVLSQFAQDELNTEGMFLLIDDTIAYTQEVCDGFRTHWTEAGNEIAGEAYYRNSDPNVRSQINEIMRSNANTVMICGYAPGAPSAMRQLRAAGFEGTFLAPNTLDGTFWLDTLPDVSGLYVSATRSVYGDDPSASVQAAIAAHQAKFGSPHISGFALSGYAAVEAMAKAVEMAASTDGKAVAAALDSFKDVELLNGLTSFSPDLHINADRPMAIIEFKNGVPSYVGTTDPGSVVIPGF